MPKREVVRRDRGWRWGVMTGGSRNDFISVRSCGAHAVAIAIIYMIKQVLIFSQEQLSTC